LIVFATETEAAPFKSLFRRMAGTEVDVLISGIGQVNAARALTAYFERHTPRPDYVIMGGCAGAFKGSGLNVGDVCFATEEIYADTGVNSPDGFLGLEATGIPVAEIMGVKYYNRFPIPALSDKIEHGMFLFKISAGPFATVSAVTGTEAAAAGMEKRWSAVCENMEGAAAAHVSLLYGVPFAEVRGISNMVEDRDRTRWDINTACANCALIIKKLVENL
jgi:futalosine hydrolase